jgi:hypothetical protein
MLTDALGAVCVVSYLEQGWQLNWTVVAQDIMFIYGALQCLAGVILFFLSKNAPLLSRMKLFFLSNLLPSARK